MATEAQDHPNRLNALKIELCSTLSLSKSQIRHLFDGILPRVAPAKPGPLSVLYIYREPSTNQLLFMQNKPNFQKSQMNVNPYNTTDYENKSNWTLGQNKPNSNPNKPNFLKAQMNVNSLITKDYRKYDDFEVRINKPNFVKVPK